MNKAFRWLAVFIVTFIVCVAGSVPVFVTSIFVKEVVSFPLTILVMGLLAALTSSWMSNLLSGDSTHSRILPIVGVTEVVAALLIPFRDMFYVLVLGPGMMLLVIWGIVLSLSAYLATWRFRSTEYKRTRDIVTSLVLLALAPTVVVVAIAIASQFGLTGA